MSHLILYFHVFFFLLPNGWQLSFPKSGVFVSPTYSTHRWPSEAYNRIVNGRTNCITPHKEYFSYPFSEGTASLIRPIRPPNGERARAVGCTHSILHSTWLGGRRDHKRDGATRMMSPSWRHGCFFWLYIAHNQDHMLLKCHIF